MHNKPLFAISILAFAVSQVVYAAETNKKNDKEAKMLPEMTVSDEGVVREDLLPESPRNAFRLPESSMTHSQTITREEIQQLRPRDLYQLLDNATGVIATQGSRKGFSGLSIRGDSNFRYIVDGAYLQPTMASRMMAALPVMAIEQVKIVRGSSALTMGPMSGSASAGGAPVDGFIIITTRKPSKDGGQVRVAGETYSGVKADLLYGKTFGDRENKGYVQGLISHSRTDGPSSKLDNGLSYNRQRQTTDGMFKGGYAGNGLIVDFMTYQDEGSFGIPNANSHGTGNGNWTMNPSRTEIYVLNGSFSWNDIHTTLFSASHSTSDQHFITGASAVDNINKVTHLNVRHNMDFYKTRVMFGGDFMHWNAPNGQQYYEGIQREEDTLGWFVQAEQKLFDDKLTLDASYRGDKVDVLHGLDYYTGGNQPPGGVNTSLKTTNKTLPVATFFSVGSTWEFFKGWKLMGRYGQTSVSSGGMNVTAGTQLKTQEQFKWEIGIEGKVAPLFNPSLNYFHRESTNELLLYGYTYTANNNSKQTCRTGVLPTAGATAPKSTSTLDPCYSQGDTMRDGFEFTSTGNLGLNTSYQAGWTTYTRLNKATVGITPRNMVNFSFRQGFDVFDEHFNFTGAFKYLPKYKGAITDTNAYLGGYARYDLGLGYDLRLPNLPIITTTLYGQNISNVRFETNNGVQDIGRVLGIEVNSNF